MGLDCLETKSRESALDKLPDSDFEWLQPGTAPTQLIEAAQGLMDLASNVPYDDLGDRLCDGPVQVTLASRAAIRVARAALLDIEAEIEARLESWTKYHERQLKEYRKAVKIQGKENHGKHLSRKSAD